MNLGDGSIDGDVINMRRFAESENKEQAKIMLKKLDQMANF